MKTLQQIADHIANSNTAALAAEAETTSQSNKPISIYFLNNFTINPIEPILKIYLLESRLCPTIVFGNYDSVQQEILDNTSALYLQPFSIVVCSLMYSPIDPCFLNKLDHVAEFIEEIKSIFDLLRERTGALLLMNTFILPFAPYANAAPISDKATHAEAITKLNQFIREYTRQHNTRCFLSDWTRYLQLLGEEQSIDYRYAYLYQAPFKKLFLSHYANDITRIARALNGYAKKCLILDCDNTLWGGIIGEDGISGVQLDNHDYPGKVFYDFQYGLLALAERGVILTLCSKNNEEDVWNMLENHPHSLLRRKHFAAARINWENKASNIVSMIHELNLGLDSCVFIDDSPVECEWVKNAIPDITVLQVLKSLYNYPTLLFREGLFDTLAINAEDSQRHLYYQQEAERKAAFKQANDIQSYLASLELTASMHLATNDEIARIAQLTQKTNQFNLSTHRYTQQQIESTQQSNDAAIFSLHAADKFGNYGLTGTLIAKRQQGKGFIDTLLLSCRILSRNFEYLFLEHCLKFLEKAWGITWWEAEYIPTPKNGQIKEFLDKAGFECKGDNLYLLDLKQWDGLSIKNINIVTEEFEHA